MADWIYGWLGRWGWLLRPSFWERADVPCATCGGEGSRHCKRCNSTGACHDCCIETLIAQREAHKRSEAKAHEWAYQLLRDQGWFAVEQPPTKGEGE